MGLPETDQLISICIGTPDFLGCKDLLSVFSTCRALRRLQHTNEQQVYKLLLRKAAWEGRWLIFTRDTFAITAHGSKSQDKKRRLDFEKLFNDKVNIEVGLQRKELLPIEIAPLKHPDPYHYSQVRIVDFDEKCLVEFDNGRFDIRDIDTVDLIISGQNPVLDACDWMVRGSNLVAATQDQIAVWNWKTDQVVRAHVEGEYLRPHTVDVNRDFTAAVSRAVAVNIYDINSGLKKSWSFLHKYKNEDKDHVVMSVKLGERGTMYNSLSYEGAPNSILSAWDVRQREKCWEYEVKCYTTPIFEESTKTIVCYTNRRCFQLWDMRNLSSPTVDVPHKLSPLCSISSHLLLTQEGEAWDTRTGERIGLLFTQGDYEIDSSAILTTIVNSGVLLAFHLDPKGSAALYIGRVG